ncbi:hypothetical protein GOV07_05885 [Candidatus Woesearchaeota archaeon]|nr:hypothetical protein [Candidatus Woesearchaeota archaeon]
MRLEGIIEQAKDKRSWLVEQVKDKGPGYLSDSTAVATIYTPVYAFGETVVAGMSHALSQDARLLGLLTIYGGLGKLIGYGRDLSEKAFKITDETSKTVKNIHDTLYLAATGLIINPPFYFAVGSRDPKEIFWGTVFGVGVGAAAGIPMGYALDWFRDLTGVQESKRLPPIMKHASAKTKKKIAASLVAAGIALTAVVYNVVPDKGEKTLETAVVEQFEPSADLTQNL